jgi:formylglycine-generating enzyme required for sulfatase activity
MRVFFIGWLLLSSCFVERVIAAGKNPPSVVSEQDRFGRRLELTLNDVPFHFRVVGPGRFSMGSPDDERGRYDDEVRHGVTLTREYAIGQYEVTQAQWTAVMRGLPAIYAETVAGPSRGPGGEVDNGERAKKVVQPKELISTRGNTPIVFVSYDDCRKFCDRLNASLSGWRVRLPTEAEWEYACRAGTESALNDGGSLKSTNAEDKTLDRLAWYQEGGDRTLRPVGGKLPNVWGLFDMHGNAAEWCADYYGPYEAREARDPQGPQQGANSVIRGGSYDLNAEDCRSAWRIGRPADERHKAIGFRIVLEPSNP